MLCSLALSAVCAFASQTGVPNFDIHQAERNAYYLGLHYCERRENGSKIENGVIRLKCVSVSRPAACYKIYPSKDQGYCYVSVLLHKVTPPRQGQTKECVSSEIYYRTVWDRYDPEDHKFRHKTVRTHYPGAAKPIPVHWDCHWGIRA